MVVVPLLDRFAVSDLALAWQADRDAPAVRTFGAAADQVAAELKAKAKRSRTTV